MSVSYLLLALARASSEPSPTKNPPARQSQWRASIPNRRRDSNRSADSFLTHQIQVGVAADARVHHGREIAQIIVSVAAGEQRECEGKLQRHLWLADQFSTLPALAVKRNVTLRRHRIRKRLAIRRERNAKRDYARQKRNALLVRKRELVDSIPFSGAN